MIIGSKATLTRDDMEAYWLPFTRNQKFKEDPRLFSAASGMYYTTDNGRQVLDGMAGLWCVNAGHGSPRIVKAIQEQAACLDFVPSFQMSHSTAFVAAKRIADLAPTGLDHVFFTNSGSEAVETALKVARAYFHLRGEAGRTRLIGRAKGYHGMGFGGLSVSGIARHRRDYGPLLGDVDHLPHTHSIERNMFSKGQPAWGGHLADELEALVQLHDASTIAAVIVEPVAGSGGVLPPPQGYLERLRHLCTRHGILLIFDEVITAFGRLGAPFGSTALGVTPDIITCAKGLTNGAVPMGAVIVSDQIYRGFVDAAGGGVELFHGYTYSGHPLACAASIATLDTYEELGLFQRAARLALNWQELMHQLQGKPFVRDIRNIGMLAAIELDPRSGEPGARSAYCANYCFEHGVLLRTIGEALVLSPPLIISEAEIELIFGTISEALANLS